MNKLDVRFPAEWEPVEAVLVAWPHQDTDWAPMLDEVRRTYGRIIYYIARYAKVIVVGPRLPTKNICPRAPSSEISDM